MSIFIKDMKKPKNCFGCDFNMYDCYCKINNGGIDRDFWDCDKECPIVEVPVPHGDLIDKSQIKVVELEDSVHLMRWERNSEVDFRIEAPTVIEAEGTE